MLQRKVERERNARKTAEKQLEDYSRQIYYSNQALQRSLNNSHKRQRELEYLAKASASVASDQDLTELLHSTADLTAKFANAVCATYFVSDRGEVRTSKNAVVWYGENDWREVPELYSVILKALPESDEILDNWYMRDAPVGLAKFDIDGQWLVALNFELIQDKVGWLVFVLDQEMLDEETLYVLDTAKSHIRAGILRRVDERKLEQKNRQLSKAITRLETAQTQLVHSEKMASLGQLSAGVAHEINNPIGFILSNHRVMQDYINDLKSFLTDLKQQASENQQLDSAVLSKLCDEHDIEFLMEDIESLVKDNEDGAEKVADIVNSLKNFSHSGDAEHQNVDIADCISKARKVAGNVLKNDRQLLLQLPEQIPPVNGNASQLQQVLINLLVNAAHATEENGKITVSVRESDNHLNVAVADNGCGMDETTLNRLFTPFFTTKDIGVGTGLGLSVSHGIIEAHGGDILVESEPGKGSVFTLVLPLADVSEEASD
ncbi:sensor histidine kinase [Planctobacterium marinum]|uniref:sensor histidine kinase n=1 Tax=Planctobacterium marinum TaxID=1631968 RepID=UPI0030C69F2F